MLKGEQSGLLLKGLLGGLLAGVACFCGSFVLMPLALALLWYTRRSIRASFFWGLLAVLGSHLWLLWLHPLTWLGVPSAISLPVVILIWTFCGIFGGALICGWALLGIFLESKGFGDVGETNSFWHCLAMASLWGLGEVFLAKSPLFFIGLAPALLPQDRILAGLARWFGSGGLATIQLLIGWWILAVYLSWANRPARQRLLKKGLITLVIAHLIGWISLKPLQAYASINIGAWQSAVPTREKFSEEQRLISSNALDLALFEAKRKKASFLVAPEGTLSAGQRLISPSPIPLLSGGFRWEKGKQRSSLLVFGAGDSFFNNFIDKHRLVPLGEWIPSFLDFGSNGLSAVGGVQAGETSRLLNWQGPNAAVAICYEISDGNAIAMAVKGGADWLLTIANLDPYPIELQKQFISIAQLRSFESGRDLLSVSNTGPSALLSPSGDVQLLLEPFKKGVAVAKLNLYKGTTPYMLLGEIPLFLGVIIGIFFIVQGRRFVEK